MKTEAEVRRAIERLSTHGFEARSEPHSEGHLMGLWRVTAPVAVDELLIDTAPTVRRVLVPQ